MPHSFQISRDSEALFITLVTRNRLPVFKTDTMKAVLCRAIAEALLHPTRAARVGTPRTSGRLLLFAYVLMPDHMHLLTNKPSSTSAVLRVLKGITARRVIHYLKEQNYLASLAKLKHQERERNYRYSLWQSEKNVLPIFSEGMFMQKVNYIHLNPVRGELVSGATEYRWSSAHIWQRCPSEDEPLLVDVDRINWRWRFRKTRSHGLTSRSEARAKGAAQGSLGSLFRKGRATSSHREAKPGQGRRSGVWGVSSGRAEPHPHIGRHSPATVTFDVLESFLRASASRLDLAA